jgi:hypothetical protein
MVPVLLAAATKVYQGGIAVVNAAGYGVPGSTSTTQTYIGRFEETVDNSGGSAGAKSAMVRRKKAFAWKNSSADPVTQAGLFKDCYIVDDETVAATNGTNTRSKAGKVIAIDSNGVWVE